MQIERELTSELESERGKLISLLQKHGIPLELWGKESAKTIDDLLAEIRSSESVIKATERERDSPRDESSRNTHSVHESVGRNLLAQ